MGNCFRCYCRQIFISLAFRKCKKDCKILKITLVQDFCPLKSEIARFSIGFHLKCFRCSVNNQFACFRDRAGHFKLKKWMVILYVVVAPCLPPPPPAGPRGTWVNFCLSEPRPHYSLFCGMANHRPHLSHF